MRVLRMLKGTSRKPDEVVGLMPPDLVPVTVEKVAINAVLAGCKPEYMPVLLAALEAALTDEFGLHGLICTTMFGSPMIVVNGPAARAIGMNSGVNALGQGNRANATIGRALQLIIRNVGGGRPARLTAQRWVIPASTASVLPRPKTPTGCRWRRSAVLRSGARR
ncbi:hypothetical protein ULF88_25280 [Halopseudomonas pachastrellae]|nr:hypothetical protein [Halopseudomonas pachastrellae]